LGAGVDANQSPPFDATPAPNPRGCRGIDRRIIFG
jgi:hypothetical protein